MSLMAQCSARRGLWLLLLVVEHDVETVADPWPSRLVADRSLKLMWECVA